jgi:flagellar motor switch protein FliM
MIDSLEVSMPTTLDQEEVAALLSLVQKGGGGSAAANLAGSDSSAAGPAPMAGYRVLPSSEVQLYDFKRPERVSKEQIIALETLHEIFARNLSASLSGYLRAVVEVRLISVEQFTYSEFTMSLPSPTSINLLSCAPLEGNMVLEINPSIIFPVIDRLLGGGTAEAFLLDRPFTDIEQGLVNSILTRVLEQLTQSWEKIRPLRFEIVESESNPFLMQIVAPNEPVVLHSFEVLMGEYSGMINLCIPFKVIEPIIPEFSTSNWFVSAEAHAHPGARELILENISQATVEVTAILADLPLRLADLLTLKPGDVIDTQKPVNSELVLAVEAERKFAGLPATSQGKIAFRITRREEPQPLTPRGN